MIPAPTADERPLSSLQNWLIRPVRMLVPCSAWRCRRLTATGGLLTMAWLLASYLLFHNLPGE